MNTKEQLETLTIHDNSRSKKRMNEQMKNLIIERERYNTNHGLHLLLTLFTGGLWAIVWFLQHTGNKMLKKECEQKIEDLKTTSEETQ